MRDGEPRNAVWREESADRAASRVGGEGIEDALADFEREGGKRVLEEGGGLSQI